MLTRRIPATAIALMIVLAMARTILQAPSTFADDGKPAQAANAKPKIALLVGGAADDLRVIRESLDKVPAIKFKADEIKFADFGKDGGKFTSFFTLEMTDRAKTDLGAIAKAVAGANTSKKEQCPPALFLIVKYKPDSVKNEQLRAVLAKVNGLRPEKSWAGDANLWVSVDGSGKCRLGEITRALHDAGIKIRDPITDTADQ